MRSLRLAIVEQLPQNLHETGASRVLDDLLLALDRWCFYCLCLCVLLLLSARRTLESCILVDIHSPVAMDCSIFVLLFRKLS